MTSSSIDRLKAQALNAIMQGKFIDAIELWTRMIRLVEPLGDRTELSELMSYRAACQISAKNTSLYHLRKMIEAKEAILIGRAVAGEHESFDRLEALINNEWFTLGNRGVKLLTTLGLTIVIGIITNLIGQYSVWKQVALILSWTLCTIIFMACYERIITSGFKFDRGLPINFEHFCQHNPWELPDLAKLGFN